jgi:hypothetical protein
MRHLKVIAVVFFLITLCALQFNEVKAASTTQIVNVTSVDQWGNINGAIYRGLQTSVVLILNAPVNGTYQINLSLFDACNVPVAFTSGSFSLNGNSTLTLNLKVAAYAYVGVGKLSIAVSSLDHSSTASLNKAVYIGVLGDLTGDHVVDFQDLAFFSTAYSFYSQNHTIPPNYKCCDITGDGKIDFMDLSAFATGYAIYWQPSSF